jgi:hypothetical protein
MQRMQCHWQVTMMRMRNASPLVKIVREQHGYYIILRQDLVYDGLCITLQGQSSAANRLGPTPFVLAQWGPKVEMTKQDYQILSRKPKLILRSVPSSNNGNFRVPFVRSLEQR